MTKKEFDSLMLNISLIRQDCPDGVTDEVAYDMALDILSDNPKLEAYIKAHMGASDAVGWLSDQI
jgi:hypothetical protein